MAERLHYEAGTTFRRYRTTTVFTSVRLPGSLHQVRKANDGGQLLTPRQIAVLQLAAYGLSGGQIARHLGISVRTVHDHFNRMRERTGTRTGSELIAQAVAGGLVKSLGPVSAEVDGTSLFDVAARTRRVGLVGIGTDDEGTTLERDALAAAGCDQIFEDEADAGSAGHSGLAAAMGCLGAGDVLVVWRIDRLGRSVEELLGVVCRLGTLGAGVTIVDGDLSGEYRPNGDGRILFTVAAALADLRSVVRPGRNSPAGRGPLVQEDGHGNAAHVPSRDLRRCLANPDRLQETGRDGAVVVLIDDHRVVHLQ
jgi:DNA invertase Pin-like site-specific DNA recombinase